jgi:hypothetical protein
MRLIKFLVVLVVAAVIALVGYAYLGDMKPQQREIRNAIPVQGGELAPAPAAPTDAPAEAPAEAAAPAAEAPAADAPADPITNEDTSEAPGD